MFESGQRVGGRYVLLQRLGAGGMGEVWLAQQEGSGTFRRRVVLKCIPPERAGDERLGNMLHDEARILGLLHHPGIVAPLDFLEDETGPLLVLEYVDGPSLRTALKHARLSNTLMPEALAAYIGSEVARALQAAHDGLDESGRPLNVVHRDVSPDNVLLSRDGRVRLADFGVAHAQGNADVTDPGAAPKGKRGYMAPEQAAHRPVGAAADQFALGRVVAEAADIKCGPALRAVLDRATAPMPHDRFPSAAALGEAIAAAVPPPPDAQAQLAAWLAEAAPEALAPAETGAGSGSARPHPGHSRKPFLLHIEPDRGEREAAARAGESPPRTSTSAPPAPRDEELPFARFESGRRERLRALAGVGVLLAFLLPLALLFAAERGLIPGREGSVLRAPAGDLRVVSRPEGAEVYVDGRLRGITPLLLEQIAAGPHALRVGSLRLERWRAADVDVRAGTERRVEIDLDE